MIEKYSNSFRSRCLIRRKKTKRVQRIVKGSMISLKLPSCCNYLLNQMLIRSRTWFVSFLVHRNFKMGSRWILLFVCLLFIFRTSSLHLSDTRATPSTTVATFTSPSTRGIQRFFSGDWCQPSPLPNGVVWWQTRPWCSGRPSKPWWRGGRSSSARSSTIGQQRYTVNRDGLTGSWVAAARRWIPPVRHRPPSVEYNTWEDPLRWCRPGSSAQWAPKCYRPPRRWIFVWLATICLYIFIGLVLLIEICLGLHTNTVCIVSLACRLHTLFLVVKSNIFDMPTYRCVMKIN